MDKPLIAFMSIWTGAIRESRCKGVTVNYGGDIGRGSVEIREILDFPDGLIVYSNGSIEKVQL